MQRLQSLHPSYVFFSNDASLCLCLLAVVTGFTWCWHHRACEPCFETLPHTSLYSEMREIAILQTQAAKEEVEKSKKRFKCFKELKDHTRVIIEALAEYDDGQANEEEGEG